MRSVARISALRLGVVAFVLIQCTPGSALLEASVISFEGSTRLTFNAVGFGGEVATDGAGTWIVAGDDDGDIVYQRSADGTATWGPVTQLNEETVPVGRDKGPELAADGTGNWVAVWSYWNYADSTLDFDVVSARSSDGGLTWSLQAAVDPVGSSADIEADYVDDLATDGAGVWLLTWRRTGSSDVRISRSTDNGATWSTIVLASAAVSHSFRLAHNGSTWIGVWSAYSGTDYDLYIVRSTDAGLTWTPPALFDPGAATDSADEELPDIEADSTSWVVVWSADPPTGLDVFASRSADGSTWSAPVRVNQEAREFRLDYQSLIATDGAGLWLVGWTSNAFPFNTGGDADAHYARSRDGGASWSLPVALNTNARSDNRVVTSGYHQQDYLDAIATDGTGVWVAATTRKNHCCAPDDVLFMRSVPDCPPTPSPACQLGDLARLDMKENLGRRDSLKWRWRGSANPADFGTPPSSSDYAFCVYDQTLGVDVLVLEKEVRAGGTCDSSGGPCWTTRYADSIYRDPDGTRGAVSLLLLHPSATGRTRIKLYAASPSVALPDLPLANDVSVRAQLHNLTTGACWETSFESPIRNQSDLYRATD